MPVVADLPGVGSNLADHPQVWLDPGYGRPAQERPPSHLLATFRSSFCGAGQSPGLGPPTDLSTSDRVRAWIGQERYSIPHTIGTCAMGDRPESGSVVDAHGKVHGIDRLAVIDASIIPLPPSGFPHILAIMIAERLSSHLAHTTA